MDKYFQEGEVTGLLLCYPNCLVHLMEGKTSILMAVLRDALAAGPSEHRLAEARVRGSAGLHACSTAAVWCAFMLSWWPLKEASMGALCGCRW